MCEDGSSMAIMLDHRPTAVFIGRILGPGLIPINSRLITINDILINLPLICIILLLICINPDPNLNRSTNLLLILLMLLILLICQAPYNLANCDQEQEYHHHMLSNDGNKFQTWRF